MHILVLGASGGCGQEVVFQGQKRGHEITCLVRKQTPFEAPEGAIVIRGNALEKDLLEESLKGKDAVISCLGLNRKSKLNPWSRITSPLDLTSKTAEHLISLLKMNTKVAVISAAGVAESFGETNFMLKFLIRTSSLGPAYKDLERMERKLMDSNLDWYAVRPVTLTNSGMDTVKESTGYGLMDNISRASVACFLLDLVEGVVQPESRTSLIKN